MEGGTCENLDEACPTRGTRMFWYSSFGRDGPVPDPDASGYTRMIVYGILVAAVFIFWWYEERIRKNADPLFRIPGPLCLPLIGSLLAIGRQPHLALSRLQKKYGDVYRIHIGSVPVVVLSGTKVIREALIGQGDVFSGRPDLLTFRLASEGKSMAFNSYSKEWAIHHRLAERALKLIQNEGRFVEEVIVKEAKRFAQSLASHEGVTYDPTSEITWSVARVMYALCYGAIGDDESEFRKLVESTLKLIQCHQLGNALNFFPWFRIFFTRMHCQLIGVCDRMLQTTKRKEAEHLDSYRDGEIRDALDALIRLGVRRPCPLAADQVMHTVQEFIGAGLDILYISMSWAVLFCAKHSKIRDRMTAEIDAVIGRDRDPTEDDVRSLPYTTAFVLETLRHSCVIPMALPHSTLSDTTLAGYHIPADTMVLLNLCSVHNDPQLWTDPERFRPERYLDDVTGGLDESALDRYGAFGFGRRRCIGEQLAKQQMIIFMAVLLQKCSLHASELSISERSQSGIVLRPTSLNVKVMSRE